MKWHFQRFALDIFSKVIRGKRVYLVVYFTHHKRFRWGTVFTGNKRQWRKQNYGIIKGWRKILIQTNQYSPKIYHSSRFDSNFFFQEIKKRFFSQLILAARAYVRVWTLRSWVGLFYTPKTTRLTTSDANELVNAKGHPREKPLFARYFKLRIYL